jgi:hypothetical protein
VLRAIRGEAGDGGARPCVDRFAGDLAVGAPVAEPDTEQVVEAVGGGRSRC